MGKALVAAFRSQGDIVLGLDMPGTGAELEIDLDNDPILRLVQEVYVSQPDIVICNAKTRKWEAHHGLAKCAKVAVINLASIYGTLGPDPALYDGTEIEPTPAWYAAAKGAMIALTKHQATTLAPVRSNCIILGGIFRGHSDVFRQRYEAKVPLRRMATEQDAVDLCLFLASEKASYITGACLAVDGGLTAMA